MKPEVNDILTRSADRLMAEAVPALGTPYLQGTVSLLTLLMRFSAREYERGADIRARENADMRGLFDALAAKISDEALRAQLEKAASTRDESLTISALDAANAELRRTLIALQIHAEELNDRGMLREIWHVLKSGADRRLITL